MVNCVEHLSIHYRKKALPLAFTSRLLRRQQQRIYATYARCFPPSPDQRVLDLGVNGSLGAPELYFFEHSYPFKDRVVACGLEPPDLFRSCFPAIEYVQLRRGQGLPFADAAFDLVFCNAVIEHVGSRRQQKEFLSEALRVGRSAFVTTPNRWYPVELHTVLPFVHYLPAPWYRAIFRRLGFDFFSLEENLNLLDRRSLRVLLPAGVDAAIGFHRFLGLPSNLVLIVRR